MQKVGYYVIPTLFVGMTRWCPCVTFFDEVEGNIAEEAVTL